MQSAPQREETLSEADTRPPRDDGMRRCIVSGVSLPRQELLRFVVGPDDIVVPDLAERLPGRGLWLRAQRDIVVQACSRNQFSRAARRKVSPMVGPDGGSLDGVVEDQLVRRCLDVVSLARRAGIAVAGFDQVRQWLRSRPRGGSAGAAVLLTASDAAAGGRDKLAALAGWEDGVAVSVVPCGLLTGYELGQAFGREHLVHVLIAPHRLAGRLVTEAGRLAGFRDEDAGGRDGAASDAVAQATGDRSD